MGCKRNLLALSIALLALLAGACAPDTSEEDARTAAQAEEWAGLQQAKADLDAKRQELSELKAMIAGGMPEEEGEADGGGEEAPAEGEGGAKGEGGAEGEVEDTMTPEEKLATLQEAVDTGAGEFIGRLADFLNSQDLYEGQELTEVQRAAFDMKASEDVLVAQEYIDKAGNYQKAIDIYTSSLLADPTSEILLEAKAKAEDLRYMTEERFATVKKKMTQDEVRDLLGTPKPVNVREYEDRGIIAWFYPKEDRGRAAGVYFRERKDVWTVYNLDYDAVKADEEKEG